MGLTGALDYWKCGFKYCAKNRLQLLIMEAPDKVQENKLKSYVARENFHKEGLYC